MVKWHASDFVIFSEWVIMTQNQETIKEKIDKFDYVKVKKMFLQGKIYFQSKLEKYL